MIVTLNTTNIQANAILYLYESGGNCYVVLEYLTGLPVNEAPLQVSQSYDALQDALGSTFFEAGHASFGNILINASRLKSISAEGVLTFDNNRAVTTTSSVSAVKSAAEQASPASVQYVDENAGGLTVTTIEVDLCRTPLSRGTFTVTDAGVTSTTKIMIWQAMTSLTGKGSLADENEMDTLLLKATAGSGNFKVNWEANEGFVLAPVITGGFVNGGTLTSRPNTGAYPTADINRLFRTVKLGMVVGNFKFNYIKI